MINAERFDTTRNVGENANNVYMMKAFGDLLLNSAVSQRPVCDLSPGDNVYTVCVRTLTCTCPKAVKDDAPCKHIFVVINKRNVTWTTAMFPQLHIDDTLIRTLNLNHGARYKSLKPLVLPQAILLPQVAALSTTSTTASNADHAVPTIERRNLVAQQCHEFFRILNEIGSDVHAVLAANSRLSGPHVSSIDLSEPIERMYTIRDAMKTIRSSTDQRLPPPIAVVNGSIRNRRQPVPLSSMLSGGSHAASTSSASTRHRNHSAATTSDAAEYPEFHPPPKRPKRTRQRQDDLFGFDEIRDFQFDVVREHALSSGMTQTPTQVSPQRQAAHPPVQPEATLPQPREQPQQQNGFQASPLRQLPLFQ